MTAPGEIWVPIDSGGGRRADGPRRFVRSALGTRRRRPARPAASPGVTALRAAAGVTAIARRGAGPEPHRPAPDGVRAGGRAAPRRRHRCRGTVRVRRDPVLQQPTDLRRARVTYAGGGASQARDCRDRQRAGGSHQGGAGRGTSPGGDSREASRGRRRDGPCVGNLLVTTRGQGGHLPGDVHPLEAHDRR